MVNIVTRSLDIGEKPDGGFFHLWISGKIPSLLLSFRIPWLPWTQDVNGTYIRLSEEVQVWTENYKDYELIGHKYDVVKTFYGDIIMLLYFILRF